MMRRMLPRPGRIPALVVLILLLGAGSAHASSAEVDGSTLRYSADPGEANGVSITQSGGSFAITDSAVHFINPGSGCMPTLGGASCSDSGVTSIAVTLGDGNDSVSISSNLPTTLDGGAGDDQLDGGGGNDTLIGGAGNDQLFGGAGNDHFDGGTGDDQLNGGPGDDNFVAEAGADVVNGGDGHDTMDYSSRSDPLNITLDDTANDGSAGENDNVVGIETVIGGSGNDTITGGPGDDTLTGGPGDDTIEGSAGNDTIDGGDGADKLTGGAGDDTINGGAGTDGISGGAGSDDLHGGAGFDFAGYIGRTTGVTVTLDDQPGDGEPGENDNVHSDIEGVYGGEGNDTLIGNDQTNVLSGLGGDDTINGAGGDDIVSGDAGADTINGGDGTDYVSYSGNVPVTVTLDGQANDGATGERDNIGGDIEVIIGGDGPDRLEGNENTNILVGGDGNDVLIGGPGVDGLDAGAGNDTIDAADGTPDHISCGDGVDYVHADAKDEVSADCEDVLVDGVFVAPFTRWRMSKTGTVTVTIGCPANALQGCDGRLTLESLSLGANAGSRLSLGSLPVHVDAGKNLAVVMRLSKNSQEMVRRKKLVHVLAKLTLSDQQGHSTTTSQGSVLLAPTPKKPAKAHHKKKRKKKGTRRRAVA